MKTNFVCTNCGNTTSKWFGKCPDCGEWNTLEEQVEAIQPKKGLKQKQDKSYPVIEKSRALHINEIIFSNNLRQSTGIGEFDRVLGGGLVEGSVVLISGEPGIGKSTLLLQICQSLDESVNILYVTGEESLSQIKLRAGRVGVNSKRLLILSETNINKIIPEINTVKPNLVIIDSIQTMFDDEYPSSPGSVTQVKQSAMHLINMAKESGISVILVGHVNKDGAIAGPKVLEHMVDAILYFEGDKQQAHRIIRAVKNRYGSTNEIGVFEMNDEGLKEICNPSELLMEQRPKGVSGSCAVCILEGTRPIIAEIQALSTPTAFPSPRRMSSGFDYNRTSLLLAVLEKRLGMRFSTQDIYINVAGGLRIEDTSCDAAAALALISSLKDVPVPEQLIVVGEVGLSGELRSVYGVEQRINEAARLGFVQIAVPFRVIGKLKIKHSGVTLIPLRSVYDFLKLLGL
ncbi:MAG: DNA repair protein RadA [Clostridiales bacterium GWF2_36_10]|nr:MAG: DNA repair protein RadA [Clostridiales bacterium GWF2_36_10]HAN20955.1 DNA repair protein RadA [Clostridiales bacterium]